LSKIKTKKLALFSIILGLGLFWWYRKNSKTVPGEKFAREFLLRKAGADKTELLLTQFRSNYREFYNQRRSPQNKILRIHLEQAILPVLAFYQVLLPLNNGNQETTIDEITQVVREWVVRLTKGPLIALRFFPQPFSLFKPGFNLVMMLFPTAGFEIDYLEKSNNRISYNITRCFFLDAFNRYSLPELTPVFCAADEAMAEFFPQSIQFQRTQTLGKGGNLCDFRYCRVNQKID
jgi:hypothetical protein